MSHTLHTYCSSLVILLFFNPNHTVLAQQNIDSNTLYGATKTQQLNSDFQQFLKLKSERHKIINFHKTKVQTYNSNEYLIKNKNLQTVSITSVISEGEVLKMRYWDMLDHKKTKFLQL